MNAERLDHMTVQYVWALENEQTFMIKAKHEIERGNFSQFRLLVGRHIMPIRTALDEDHAHALSGTEWSFLYIELWHRLGGKPHDFARSNDEGEYDYQLERLREGGYILTKKGVCRNGNVVSLEVDTNPCAEIALGQYLQEVEQLCEAVDTLTSQSLSQPIQEKPMSNQIIIANKTFINNVDVTTMSDDQLIDAIKKVEKEIEDLGSVKTKSKKIEAKISEANETLNKLVSLLDAR